ncbi:sugar ABC transporter substrate-binding protein [Luteolibacter sp. AS25]|uniref:sugar ABC transporter substrate-binding protein n=1 Tax=Luteolibacter sp. AS25 TaxID=3135776 RepID=UPI00398B80B9
MKRILLGLIAITASFAIVSCNRGGDNAELKVGMTVQDLSNPAWSGYCKAIEKEVEANGGDFNYVSCESNVSKQIVQIENFIARGMDVIIVHPADPAGIENVCREAREAGIKIISWDDDIENADTRWLIDNKKLGYEIGKQAAAFIKEKHSGKAEVAILNYPQLPVLLARGNGIKEALTELAPNATIVAATSAINPDEGITKMETIFQSNPNVKVVCCIGGGGSVGANEAAKAAGKIGDDFGIFAVDATPPELQAIKDNEGVRMSVIVTGTNTKIAKEMFGFIEKLLAGEKVEDRVYREPIPVTIDNVDEFLGK